jgi:predicted lipoprotein with Yx(FWY)xxD motif
VVERGTSMEAHNTRWSERPVGARGAILAVAAVAVVLLLGGSTVRAGDATDGSSAAAAAQHPIDSYIEAWRSGKFAAGRRIETYTDEPMPPGFRVVVTDLDGPVFVDSEGKALYRWPRRELRNGAAGDNKSESECSSVKTTTNAGFMSPYPPGLLLPDLERRPSCTEAWPPVRAAADAKPVGNWTIITRKDGIRQWAYIGYALYTSALDRGPGDVLGAFSRRWGFDGPVVRRPVGPPSEVPPGFQIASTALGRLLTTSRNFSVYVSDADTPNHSNCDEACARTWIPIAAPDIAHPHGEWSIIERSSGIRQWALRKQPLYRYAGDYSQADSLKGSDVSGWHNVFMQMTPPPPRDFTVQDTTIGQVLADAHGKTIYVYFCGDDALDQLGCDHPSETQAYRLAMCGGGDALRCLKTFPYVLAPKNARSDRSAWSAVDIDPMTGRFAQPGQIGALHVWAYRDRPVYTYAGDRVAGDINADSHGEFRGEREGFKAFWLRDDYYDNGD